MTVNVVSDTSCGLDNDRLNEGNDVDMELLEESDDNNSNIEETLIENMQHEKFNVDETVPEGWSFEGKDYHHWKLTSPLGDVFRSRRVALKKMKQSGRYSIAEIEKMRTLLKYEGWSFNEKLPQGAYSDRRDNKELNTVISP